MDSRRFGRSLGIDVSPSKKQCNFDCVYCELSGAKSVDSMREVIALESIIEAVKSALKTHTNISVLTITANGEPTLYPHLQALISTLKSIVPDSIKLLLLTNGSNLWQKHIREALAPLDIVKFSCDALNPKIFKKIDRAHKSCDIELIKQGIREFCAEFSGEKVAEVLFVEGINDSLEEARAIAAFLSTLKLSRIDIGSIDRPPAYSVKPVDSATLEALAECFRIYKHLNISLPKRVERAKTEAKSYDESALLEFIKRRPLSQSDAKYLLDSKSLALLDTLCQKGAIQTHILNNITFYKITNT